MPKKDKRGFDLDQFGQVICPAFPYPLMCFNEETGNSDWKKVAAVVLNDPNDLPVKKMMLKAKKENLIYQEM